ncbi:ATP-dependent zinc metalloprotease YME1L [Venturia canescens]|uniref:ATP-dependent zinc metalloprotease YME1L n=1 Tax=Venturia canescens TaxID=32260 RepID=UPI001C9C5658|nr:ATP-dependent zinc metalloprotease YME1L [Venturia canescens]
MISLQSHNQVLYHLTQLTSAFTPITSSISTRIKRHENVNAHISTDELCPESLSEAAKNFRGFELHNLVIESIGNPPKFRQLLDEISVGRVKRPLNKCSIWNVSYVSGKCFADNKRDLSCSPISEPILLPVIKCSLERARNTMRNDNFFIGPHSHRGISIRSFRTNRNIEAEMERNPTITARLRKWMGLTKATHENGKSGMTIDQTNLENFKTLLNDHDMTKDEKQRMKVAFAEGYLAGNGRKVPGRTVRWLKILQQVVMIGITFIVLISVMASTNGSMFRIQIGKQGMIDPEEINVTFEDVKGVDEAKSELKDVVEFLKNPDKFSVLGGKLPKGVLLVGPPGTGKTLLARAVAGEAGVPFFHAAGPEFDEILVGQGARRVRDLFKAAKERAPCVIFIDEIDSVGGKRTNSVLHPYANQTINQLLSEMDGFHQNEGVIVLGATNRRDDLDKALMRPGRFDVEVFVSTPDFIGRKEIISLYTKKILTKQVDVDYLARCTTGFTGADIENMVNQAALKAAIEGAEFVTMRHLERARDKVILGPEGKGRMPDDEVNRITAYHEGGHALVAFYTKEATPLHKVTIVPRGPSLGHTSFLPEKDVYHVTKAQLMAKMDTMMGGRAAEELIFGPDRVTTGASKDLQDATRIAEEMVKRFGMSDKVGFRFHTDPNQSYRINSPEYSPSTSELIDGEVKRLLQESYERAKNILKTHTKEHKLLADALLKYETLDVEDVNAIVNGKKPQVELLNESTRTPIIEIPTNVL